MMLIPNLAQMQPLPMVKPVNGETTQKAMDREGSGRFLARRQKPVVTPEAEGDDFEEDLSLIQNEAETHLASTIWEWAADHAEHEAPDQGLPQNKALAADQNPDATSESASEEDAVSEILHMVNLDKAEK